MNLLVPAENGWRPVTFRAFQLSNYVIEKTLFSPGNFIYFSDAIAIKDGHSEQIEMRSARSKYNSSNTGKN